MRALLLFTFLTIGIVFSGCPYESDVAIVLPEQALKFDKNLKGEWIAFHEDGAREELVINKIDKTVYEILHKQFAPKNKFIATNKFIAYATDVAGTILFNIKNKDKKHLFTRYGWTGKNEFYLEAVNKEFVTENFKPDSVSTETLRFFLSKNINNSNMYDEKLEFYRKYSPEYEKVRMFMRHSGF